MRSYTDKYVLYLCLSALLAAMICLFAQPDQAEGSRSSQRINL